MSDTPKLEVELPIVNRLGLHARAAAKFVQCASGFESEIHLARGAHQVNGKSIMGVMMLAASQGSMLTLRVRGADAEEATAAIRELVAARFGEPD